MLFDLSKRHHYWFNEICKIPHGSLNEKALSDRIVEFAKEHNLEYVQDDFYNVVIYANATTGYENAAPLMLQGHMDMVCDKAGWSTHNFETDPIEIHEENGWLKANGTTLGADDGKAIAAMLTILENETMTHPKLVCVFTVQEEIGLLGAMHLDPKHIQGVHRMICLDGGPETNTGLTSAGGIVFDATKKLEFVENTDPTYSLTVQGLDGGHSGGQIHMEKGNANKLATRILNEAKLKGMDIQLVSFNGGSKMNAITRNSNVVFTSTSNKDELLAVLNNSSAAIAKELAGSDKGFETVITEVEKAGCRLSEEVSEDILDFTYLAPNGMLHRSMEIEGLTTASCNMGVITADSENFNITISIRSAFDSMVDDVLSTLLVLSARLDFDAAPHSRFPAWDYNPESKMRELLKAILADKGIEMTTSATHGGTECGVWKRDVEDMDILLTGCKATGAHTFEEAMDIQSFDNMMDILTEILAKCND